MSAIGIECISKNVYKIYRFQYRAHRNKWLTQKPGRRKATQGNLDKRLVRNAKKRMTSSGNDCVRVVDNWKVEQEENS